MKILVAEDDWVCRRLLETTMAKFGHEVTAYDNGETAWKHFAKEPFPVVVSDWMMPELDGLELCRFIRSRPHTDYTYFILITAYAGGEDACRRAMDAGVDDFLTKPLDHEQIWMRLQVAERILGYTTRIQQLESILPICSYCKKVRGGNNYWQQVENYLSRRTGAVLSHSVCPECFEKVVKPQMRELKKEPPQ